MNSSVPGSAVRLRLFYTVTVAGDFIFAATDEAAARAQSKFSVAFVREATDSDIAFVRRSLGGKIPSLPSHDQKTRTP